MTARMMTTQRFLPNNSVVAASIPSPTSCGRATTANQVSFHIDSNSRMGSIFTGYLNPSNARSDIASSMHSTTPCDRVQDPAFATKAGHLTKASPPPMTR
jgi:hypothetical protein